MSLPDQLRTFVAVYRARSVTTGAAVRGMSQPAASQQVAALERALGSPLFVRTPQGVEPTARGIALYAEASSVLDQLEVVVGGLEGRPGRRDRPEAALRLGTTAEFFAEVILPKLARGSLSVVASFDADAATLSRLERGELDAAVTGAAPGRRSLEATAIGEKRFRLVAAPALVAGRRFASLATLGRWLADRPWVAYSVELPITRRFWQARLGRPFVAPLRLVAPDLRAVAGAVERGMGCSILPTFVCDPALADGRIVEVHPVSDLIPGEPWVVSVRAGERVRPALSELVGLLSSSTASR